MITLGKEYAHWVIEGSEPGARGGYRNVIVHVITKDIDRAVAVCHDQHPQATIHSVRKSDRWNGRGIHIDVDPYGDEVSKTQPDLFWRGGGIVQDASPAFTDVNPGDQP